MARLSSYFLKWHNEVVAVINNDFSLKIVNTSFHPAVSDIFKDEKEWSSSKFINFLEDRIISRSRRDIETLLARMNLFEYDVAAIALKTRAFNFSDVFWIAIREDEEYAVAFDTVFDLIFSKTRNGKGDSITSPSGQNVKQYFQTEDGKFGIIKTRLHPYSFDAENEVVAYRLAQLLGVRCCSAEMYDRDSVFSEYQYTVNTEYLVHARQLVSDQLNADSYPKLIKNEFAEFEDDVNRMILFDFITCQEDRHLSNWGILYKAEEEEFYPLYDNGRCLFYEARHETLNEMEDHPEFYYQPFGTVGDQLDAVKLVASQSDISSLINLEVSVDEFKSCFYNLDFYDKDPEKIEQLCSWFKFAMSVLNNLKDVCNKNNNVQ